MKAKDSKRLSERNSLCYTDAHFPTRDDLLATLVAEGIDELAELRGQNTSHFIAVVTAGLITSKVDR